MANLGSSTLDGMAAAGTHHTTCNTFQPTGTPECQTSSASFGPEWFGPYMGFSHVEPMVLGHWFESRGATLPPEGQHFERWIFEQIADPSAFELWAKATRPGNGAAQTWHSALPAAWHSSTWCGDRAGRRCAKPKRALDDRIQRHQPTLGLREAWCSLRRS